MVLVGAHQPYRKLDAYGMMAVSVPLPGQLAVVVVVVAAVAAVAVAVAVGTGNCVEAVEKGVASVVEIERGLSGRVQRAKAPYVGTDYVGSDLVSVAVEPGAFQFDAVERVAPL